MAASSSGKSRFSLLLLEDGEVLLSDLAVQYHFVADSPVGSALHPLNSYPQRFVVRSSLSAVRGRIKIGTKNIFFDSDDWRDPIIRIPLISVTGARPTRDNSRSRHSEENLTRVVGTDDADDDNCVLVFANKAVFQRELGTDHPYVEVQLKGRHMFTPLYSTAVQLLDEINGLLQITATSSRRKREERLRNLVQERESRVPFDITLLEHGVQENARMDSAASAVYAMSRAPGRFRITGENIYFMPIHGDSTRAVERIPTRTIKTIRRLRHGSQNAALEIGFTSIANAKNGSSFSTLMVSFLSFQVREKAMDILLQVVNDGVEMFDRRELEAALNKWRRGQMSNFDYLMYLNMAAGRSFNDLSQYPVFPWVLNEYASDVLDLSKESSYRDLSKPIGALEPKRLAALTERYLEMSPPRFFYGTHYSTPAYTINYLVRAAPAAMLRLQNGRFDTPDRLFHSISDTWRGVLRNQGDVKELIPEFYVTDFSKGNASGIVASKSCPGEFLDNVLGLDLGSRQDGKRVDDVELPPWANGSSELFVRRHREALESVFVSSKLHTWIDLIFGVKSRNEEACNVFYTDVALPSSIESADSSKLTSEEMSQIETVYLEFGRTPEKLFGHPHPPRFGDMQFTSAPSSSVSQENSRTNTSAAMQEAVDTTGTLSKPKSQPNSLSKSELTGAHSLSNSEEEPRSLPPLPGAWGAQSRRRDSVLAGASEHILVSFAPSETEKEIESPLEVQGPNMSNLIDASDAITRGAEIIDVCLVNPDALAGDEHVDNASEPEAPVLCTHWSNGHLRVHNESRTLRSKHIGDARSIAYVPPAVIAYGTPVGTIGLYYIETGRTENVQAAAHDAEVHTLQYLPDHKVLISGSKDASIKVWLFEQSQRVATLRLIQELDAESPVIDVSGCIEMVAESIDGRSRASQLLIAAATSDSILMVWEIGLSGEFEGFLEPSWRSENRFVGGSTASRRPHKLTWLYQGTTRRPALASVHPAENCMRVWSLSEMKMALAEVFLSRRETLSITSCDGSRTVLVGGEEGQISEFDSTGLCLGRISAGKSDIRTVLLPESGKCMYVLCGANEVLRVNR